MSQKTPNAEKINNESLTKLNDRIDATLLDARRIFIHDAIDNESTYQVIRQLLYLELIAPGKPILTHHQQPRWFCTLRVRNLGPDQNDHFPCDHTCDRTCSIDGICFEPMCRAKKAVGHS